MPDPIGSGSPASALSADVEAQLRARQVDAIRRLTAPLMIVILANLSAFLLVLRSTAQLTPVALGWAALVALLTLHSLAGAWRTRNRPAPRTTSARTVRRVTVSSLVFGLAWAVPGVTFAPGLTGFAEVFAYVLLTGMVAGGAFGLYPIPAAASAYLFPVALSALAGLAWEHGLLAFGPTIVAGMFLYVFHRVIRRHGDLFMSEFVGRLELERRNRLIEELLEDARLEVLGTRQKMEERLARSDKMDAIGQLTGGIAHNFNNLLTAIQGHAELLQLEGRADPSLIAPILNGCRAGASQVQRLLSIAGKQILRPEAIRLDPLVRGMVQVVEPSLGPNFRILVRIDEDVAPPFADRAQLEGALLNLIFNARDAMPGGGEITVSCRNAALDGGPAPGAAVAISVGDTGVGMDETTRNRSTDPFFTTKPISEATGLGLSSVAGFVRQSKGELTIDTAPGRGTTVTMCLPAAQSPSKPPEPDAARSAEGAATVLVVEDMPDVRRVTVNMLETLGYRVVAASGPDEAMRALEDADRIDVVLTDILLSDRVTGLQLARDIRQQRPDLPTVFVSGWSRQDGRLGENPGNRVLPKPFTRQQLDDHIRVALAEARRDGRSAPTGDA